MGEKGHLKQFSISLDGTYANVGGKKQRAKNTFARHCTSMLKRTLRCFWPWMQVNLYTLFTAWEWKRGCEG